MKPVVTNPALTESVLAESPAIQEAARAPLVNGPAVVAEPRAMASAAKPAALVTSSLVVLCFAHFAVDFYASAISTLQPVLVERYSLTLAQVGTLGGVFMLASAVMQLFFGMVSDRLHSRLFVILGVLATGIFLSNLGMALGFKTLLLIAFLGGLGVASFHPQSTSQVTQQAGRRRGAAVAMFITSGMIGLSLGPIYFSTLADRLGVGSMSVAAVPALVVAAFLIWRLPAPSVSDGGTKRSLDWAPLRRHWKPLLLHYVLVVLRSIVHLGIGQFLTVYLYTQRGFSLWEASVWLTIFFASSAAAALVGGNLADRIGGRRVVLLSLTASVPFLMLFLATAGWVSAVCLFLGAFLLLLSNPVIIVMAQDLVPAQAGTASAMMMGFGWGVAGITFIPLIGWLGDRVGLDAVLAGVFALPLLGFLLALKLPRGVGQEAVA